MHGGTRKVCTTSHADEIVNIITLQMWRLFVPAESWAWTLTTSWIFQSGLEFITSQTSSRMAEQLACGQKIPPSMFSRGEGFEACIHQGMVCVSHSTNRIKGSTSVLLLKMGDGLNGPQVAEFHSDVQGNWHRPFHARV